MASTGATLAAPTPDTPRKENRRRSWFGLVTPKRKERPAVTAAAARAPFQDGSAPPSTHGSEDALEELDATPVRKSTDNSGRRMWIDPADSDVSDHEGTVRRKNRQPKASDSSDEIRRKDTPTLAILSRNSTVKPKPRASRIFSRSAGDRETPSVDSFLSPSSKTTLPGVLTPSKVPRRTSSVNPATDTAPQSDSCKGSPDKPLPLLPSEAPRAGPAHAIRAVSLPVYTPLPPMDIVVTPSSPLDKDPFEGIFGLGPSTAFNEPERGRTNSAPVSRSPSTREPRSAVVRSESPSPMPARASSFDPTMSLGLGLPESRLNRAASTSGSPMLPKKHSVSSPLPAMRAPSPGLTVTFAADDKPVESKEPKKPRPRSLSAMFARSPAVPPEITDDDEPPTASKFNWLGVRKTIKRRRSESRLKRRSGFVSDNDAGPSEPSTDDQRDMRTSPQRPTNASMPVLMSSSQPLRAASTSSMSSMSGTVTEQEFWPAQEWAEEPVPDVELIFPEKDDINLETPVRREVPWINSASPRSSVVAASPLSSLPELGPPPVMGELEPPPPAVSARVGRGRSLSDAARRTQRDDNSLSSSPAPFGDEFGLPVRPSLASRTPSGGSSNSAINKMRSVFRGARPRSNSNLRFGGSADERDGSQDLAPPRPGSSASTSSFTPSPALPPVRIRPEDVPQVSTLALNTGEDDRRVTLAETPERSPRSSFAASMSSKATQSTRRFPTNELQPTHPPVAGRKRASTISSGATSWQGTLFSTAGTYGHGSATHLPQPGPSVPIFPTAATPPRQRPGSIRRLSTGLFRSNPSSPRPVSGSGNLFPPPSRSGSVSAQGASPNEEGPSRLSSPVPYPVGSAALMVARSSVDDKHEETDIGVRPTDTPDSWLSRLSRVNRRELAGILASTADGFHGEALRQYMARFDFTHIALDVALRRLLMHMSLPKETQQIDRVVEAFAAQYDTCEPGLFGAKDNGYVLAFSMMMLHTDAFNRHNKNKMSKADYVRNTRLDGVPETVLEVFYDNITFTPFVFIEDDHEAALAAAGTPLMSGPRSAKIDVYDLIVGGQLGTLRVDVERHIPPESPFSCMGTRPFLDIDRMQRAFANAHPLQFVKSRPRRKSSLSGPLGGDKAAAAAKSVPKEEVTTLKITKVGLIERKDDTPTNGKRTTGRKWKSWSVILTGSQLLFFKDTIWALTLMEQIRSANKEGREPVAPRTTGFQPDEVLQVKDCVAVFDRDYTQTPFTFRFVMPDSRQFLMQATDEYQMNEWLTLINYASTFKTAGIRMRAVGINSGEAMRAGTTAAEWHRRDVANGNQDEPTPPRAIMFSDTPSVDLSDSMPAPTPRPKLRRVGSLRSSPAPVVDVAGANQVVADEGEQLEAVIGSVKAELAAGRAGPLRMMSPTPDTEPLNQTLRSDAINARVQTLKEAAAEIEKRLSAALRIARNLAILTPFQKTTRDRVEGALPELGQQIRSDRIELSKLHLWITLLLKDQDRDQRDWARVRHVALQAAAKSLRAPPRNLSMADRRATIGAHPIPKLELPEEKWALPQLVTMSPGEYPVSSPHPLSEEEPSHQSAQLSPTSGANSDSEYELAPEYLSAASALSFRDEIERGLAAQNALNKESLRSMSAPPGGRESLDEAEHWRNTRAATKVSLAHLPRNSLGELSSRWRPSYDNDRAE